MIIIISHIIESNIHHIETNNKTLTTNNKPNKRINATDNKTLHTSNKPNNNKRINATDNKTLANNLSNKPFNMPPQFYCSPFSSLPYADAVGDYPLAELVAAANLPPARCHTTGFAIATPFNALQWALRFVATRYPNPAAAVTLVKCLRLGVEGDRTKIQIGPNLISAKENATAIDENIVTEIKIGRRKGPFKAVPFSYFFSNPLGVVLKKGKSKPRVIHHLSWPRSAANSSVNASIIDFEVKLDAFDRAVRSVRELGKGCHMSKIDIESAYRCIPVNPLDWPLLGFQWRDQFYFDIVMQFGITSATDIFEWYSSAAQYIAERSLAIKHLVHYVVKLCTPTLMSIHTFATS